MAPKTDPRVITFLNWKGGAGKSTLSFLFASLAAARGKTLALYDTDPQGATYSACEGARDGVGFSFHLARVGHDAGEAERVFRKITADPADVVVVDTPPGNEPVIYAALKYSSVVVVPIPTRGVQDVRGSGAMAATITAAVKAGHVRVVYVFNAVKERTILNETMYQMAGRYGITPHVTIPETVAIGEAFYLGRALHDHDPGHRANEAINHLYLEVMGHE